MKLKEFDLWAFKLELSESKKFSLFIRCVCAHFERHFQPIETDGIYRIILKLSDQDQRTWPYRKSGLRNAGVMESWNVGLGGMRFNLNS